MARLSSYFLPTLRDDPADAEALSNKLMVRAGLIRQVGAGMWTFLPAGYRVVKRVEAIIREEIDGIGGQEMLMPVLQPAELWERTGRYGIDELFKLRDRKNAPLVLAMTHEEVVTFHVARDIRSYRELPKILYHVQTKERDEARPRAGVLRTREFTMKDSYSFDRDMEGLDRSYDLHKDAYERIFDRCGLRTYCVEADVGMMGGSGAHEFLAPCEAGENEVALAPGYAANVEVASAEPQPVKMPPPLDEPRDAPTPGMTTVEEVSGALGVPAGALIKALPVVVGEDRMVIVLVRGDHRLNEIKLRNALGADFRPAHAEEIAERVGPPGFIGPVGTDLPVIKDAAIVGRRLRLRRQQARHPPDRRRARARLPLRGDGRAFGRGGRPRARRPSDRDRAGDRGGPDLQAGHALFGAARRQLPRRGRQRAADRDGQLRDRPGADGRGGDRAARRRAGDRLAAADRPVGRSPRRPGQGR